jgi:hypothetical protein
MMPAMTPMTMPAIAPPLRPLFVVEAAMPAVELVEVGVLKGTVVVGEPVEVIV